MVGAEGEGGCVCDGGGFDSAQWRGGVFIGHQQGGDEDGEFVDEIFLEQRRAEAGAGFDEHRGNAVFAAEVFEVLGEVEAACRLASNVDMYAVFAKPLDAGRWSGRQAKGDDWRFICCANERGVEREFSLGVDDDAGGHAASADASRGEQWIVGLDRADPSQDGIDAAAFPVDEPAAALTRDPLAVAGSRGDAPVEGLRPLGCDPRQAGAKSVRKRRQQCGAGGGGGTPHLDARGAQHLGASASLWVRIGFGVDNRFDAGCDDGFRTGWRAAVVAARLERHVERAACCAIVGRLHRGDFSMGAARAAVVSASDNTAGCIDDNAADEWIGLSAAVSSHGQSRCAVEPMPVDRGVHRKRHAHVWASTSSLRLGGMTRYSAGSMVELARP